ncbi:MAG: RNA-binding transcriptional accessory protein [Planctomycetes bacterium GWF2_41_51]|nr:MAG: RNA-binding transcriptional accessory protein [Planctomycetes bacterium GWF2_41_51]HBG28921.1 RNA-binding transcriptional accessory protein [Phycisphaerales bacterium]
MEEKHIAKIAGELNITAKQVGAVGALLAENATVPFIARYRKEATGSLDEVAITNIRDRLEQLAELDKRREAILESLEKLGHLTPELKDKVTAAETMAVLEDIYLPFRPKRRTRATVAKEKGLEPLAKLIFEQASFDVEKEAEKFISAEKEVETIEAAIAGARDIIAEWISEDQQARADIRLLYQKTSKYVCKVVPGKEKEAIKYKDYYDWSEPLASAPSHRVLAMRRGAKEELLLLRVIVDDDQAVSILNSLFIKSNNSASEQVKLAIKDSFKRLIMLSMETEIRIESKKKADEEAIRVFVENIRQLLLSSPLGEKSILAIDPGFRTGCKVVCLDRQGKLLYNDVIYLLGAEAAKHEGIKIMAWCQKYKIEAIAIGNGTASRETESFVRAIGLPKEINIVMVNESGASVYSASEAARDEFPDYDITVRGAVSIGRRLMDPLAELVKIDPKSIGVGQYQHDVDQTLLKRSLDDTVSSCVNAVGVEVNTASKQLLTYVSGVGPKLAENIVQHRNENGPFESRSKIKKVSGLGGKTFEQCAGFLRIRNAKNSLDASAVHPESYDIVEAMAKDLNCSVADLISNSELREKIKLEKYVTETVGLPTLMDIKAELSKPGRDPRKQFELFSFKEGIKEISDLEVGMELPGIVTNITAFGAFVDVGVHQDGLVHISELSDQFVKDPADVVKVYQKVKVRVLEVDIARKRISMSMKKEAGQSKKSDHSEKHQPLKPNKKPMIAAHQPKPANNKSPSGSLASKLTFGS